MPIQESKNTFAGKIPMFQLFGQQLSIPESIGFVFGIGGVWLTIRQNIFCFPIGIISVAIYSFIFFDSKLYANAFLQLVYIALLIYGWIQWKNRTFEDKKAITTSGSRLGLTLLIIGIITSVLVGYILRETTDAPLPFWDAATTSMSLVAQWLVAKKKLENWLLWIVVDIISVGMYMHLSLYLTAILYFVYFLLAIKGYIEWKKAMGEKTLSASH